MQANFEPALKRILVYEGGKVNNPADPGGRTNLGITQSTYNNWLRKQNRPSADVYSITMPEVSSIYETEYWIPCGANELPSGLDLCVFDGAVNSGVGQSVTWLQNALGIDADGAFGLKTEHAATDADDETVINAYCERRLGTLEELRTWPTFGKGWSARIANCRKIADTWAEAGQGTNVGPSPVDVTSLNGHQKAKITDLKASPTVLGVPVSQVTTHVVTVGSATSTAVAQVTQSLTPVGDTFSWIKYILGGLTIVSAIVGILVMIAKNASDAASAGTKTSPVNATADEGLPTVEIKDDPVVIKDDPVITPAK